MKTTIQTLLPSQEEIGEHYVSSHVNSEESATTLPLTVQKTICHNPLPVLTGVKNIFQLGRHFFKKPAINFFGCDFLTKFVVDSLKDIQSEACQTIDHEEAKDFSEGIESIGKKCAPHINQMTFQALASCYPTYNTSATPQEVMENVEATKLLCQKNFQAVPKGERIKLCSDIDKELHYHNKKLNSVSNQRALYQHSKETLSHEEILKILELRFRKSLYEKQIIEGALCTGLLPQDKDLTSPQDLLASAVKSRCFSSHAFASDALPSFVGNDTLLVSRCKTFIEKLHSRDRKQLCQNPTLVISPPAKMNRFFQENLETVKTICGDLNDIEESKEEDIEATLKRITASNETNGLTNLFSLDNRSIAAHYQHNGFLSHDYSDQAHALINDSSRLDHKTSESYSGAISALAGGISMLGIIGISIGFWLVKKKQKETSNTNPETVLSSSDSGDQPLPTVLSA